MGAIEPHSHAIAKTKSNNTLTTWPNCRGNSRDNVWIVLYNPILFGTRFRSSKASVKRRPIRLKTPGLEFFLEDPDEHERLDHSNSDERNTPQIPPAPAASVAAYGAPTLVPLTVFGALAPSNRIHLGAIGHPCEHRLKELRDIAAGPLPGQTLVVWDPDRRLVVDAFPCEDGHAQERSLLIDVLDSMEPGEVWIADRNFCTSLFLFQTAANDAYFVVRQHATNVRWEVTGERRKVGRTATGMVYQQRVDLIDNWGNRLSVRRITIMLDQPTEDGDTEIHLFSNLPNRVKATRIAEAYRGRWTVEGAFGELATALNCEIRSLGYPPAALFAFGVGLVAYNILSVVRTALAAAHGEECLDEISAYYVADEIRGMMRGMMVVISDEQWQRQFGQRSARQMSNILVALAKRVDLACFRKHRRGPKKPRPKRTRFKRKGHVSTARILAESRGREFYLD